MAKTPKISNLTAAIDDFGILCAQIADLEHQKATLRKMLIEAIGKNEAAEGDIFRVAISTSDRETLDMDAVRAKLSPQFIAAHTRTTEVVTVRATARNAIGMVA